MSIRSDLRQGRELGIPACCRWLFATQYALNPDHEQAVHRGLRFNPDGAPWVPCGVFHHATVAVDDYNAWLASLPE